LRRADLQLQLGRALVRLERRPEAWGAAREAFDLYLAEQAWEGAAQACDILFLAEQPQSLAALGQVKAAPFKIAKEAAAAAESFINKPGTIAIEAKPSAPFAFAQLMGLMGKPDPAMIDKLTTDLGLKVTAN